MVEADSLTKKEQVTASTTTDKEGQFLIAPNTGWGIYFVGQAAYFPYRYRLEVRSGEESLYSPRLLDFEKGISPRHWKGAEITVKLKE